MTTKIYVTAYHQIQLSLGIFHNIKCIDYLEKHVFSPFTRGSATMQILQTELCILLLSKDFFKVSEKFWNLFSTTWRAATWRERVLYQILSKCSFYTSSGWWVNNLQYLYSLNNRPHLKYYYLTLSRRVTPQCVVEVPGECFFNIF